MQSVSGGCISNDHCTESTPGIEGFCEEGVCYSKYIRQIKISQKSINYIPYLGGAIVLSSLVEINLKF